MVYQVVYPSGRLGARPVRWFRYGVCSSTRYGATYCGHRYTAGILRNGAGEAWGVGARDDRQDACPPICIPTPSNVCAYSTPSRKHKSGFQVVDVRKVYRFLYSTPSDCITPATTHTSYSTPSRNQLNCGGFGSFSGEKDVAFLLNPECQKWNILFVMHVYTGSLRQLSPASQSCSSISILNPESLGILSWNIDPQDGDQVLHGPFLYSIQSRSCERKARYICLAHHTSVLAPGQ